MSDREMSAQDLLEHLYRGLSIERGAQVKTSARDLPAPTGEIAPMEHCAAQSAPGVPSEESVTAMTQPVHARTVATSVVGRRKASSRLVLALSVAVAGVIVVGALQRYSASDRPVPSSMTTALQGAGQLETSVTTSDGEVEPVLFTNPFDEREVFEFPPGTSEAEARDAVADMLMRRAIERQDQLAARLSG